MPVAIRKPTWPLRARPKWSATCVRLDESEGLSQSAAQLAAVFAPGRRANRWRPVGQRAGAGHRDGRARRARRRAVAGQAQTQLTQAEGKLAELEQYFRDYQQQWMQQGSQGVSGQWLMNYQRFLSQLESAIGQQQRSVNWYRDNLLKVRQQWHQRHARVEGLSKLIESYQREARIAADKREQKLLDEFAQRLAGRSREH